MTPLIALVLISAFGALTICVCAGAFLTGAEPTAFSRWLTHREKQLEIKRDQDRENLRFLSDGESKGGSGG